MHRSHRTLACAISALALLTGLSGCADEAVERIQEAESTACATDQKTIQLATDVYYANGGASGTATVEALVAAGLLRAPSSTYTVVGGTDVVPIPGGRCDTAGGTGGTAAPSAANGLGTEQCEADRLTLQGAVDAFGAAYSVSPMDEAELVRARLLTVEVQGYDLQGATVVPVEGACA